MDSEFDTIEGDIEYAQLGDTVLVMIIDDEHLPVDLRRESEQSSLHAGMVMQPTSLPASFGVSQLPLTVEPGEIVLFRCPEGYPERFWCRSHEYQIVSPEDIVLMLRTQMEMDDHDDLMESYGELGENVA